MAQAIEQRDAVAVRPREVDLSSVTWWTIGAIAVALVSLGLRLISLDWWPLSVDEARRTFQALSLYDGRPLEPGESLSKTAPLQLLMQASSFFLFGVTDVVARFFAVAAGAGIVVLSLTLHPFAGRAQSMAMALLAAFSPTLLFSSRTAQPEILAAFFGLFILVCFLYGGKRAGDSGSPGWWCAGVGVGLGGLLASGPASISVFLCLLVGFAAAYLADSSQGNPLRRSTIAILRNLDAVILLALSFAATILFAFSRGLSSVSALGGLPETIADWGRLVASEPSATPTQFFLLVILLYEVLAVFCGIVGFALATDSQPGRLSPLLFLGWFVASLILFSFSSGRAPEQAVLVVLPLVLWGGDGAGSVVSAFDWRALSLKRTLLLVASMFGLILAILALIAAVGRIGETGNQSRDVVETLMIALIAVFPLAFVTFVQIRDLHRDEGGIRYREPLLALCAAIVLLLTAYSLRSTVLLNYYRADTSLELLAQRTSTQTVPALVDRVENLSRDLTVREGSSRDPEGGHGISIAIEQPVQWPFRWYFRDFPELQIVPDGQAVPSGADFVIAQDSGGMDQASYAPRVSAVRNRVPPEYVTPSIANVLKSVFLPSRWQESVDFLLYRTGIVEPEPETVTAGFGTELANQLFPSSGPYALSDRPGPGSGRGQFNEPRGIATDITSGLTYVVDMGNGRIERFDSSGQFAGSWGGPEGMVEFGRTEQGLGPTGIAVGFDGLVYVADTWNHRIVVLNEAGQSVREFGSFADTLDAPNAGSDPGMFFGPRAVAVTADEIFVTDTGNERIQVFAPDGTFVRAWGGYGSGPDQFIEPVGVTIGPDGRVYVADSGNGRISVFARTGTPLDQWPVEAWQGNLYFEPYLAFDQDGLLYATSSATGSVEVFDLEGNHITSIRGTGSEEFESPIGITNSGPGRLYVTDKGKSAVLEFSSVPPPATGDIPASPPPSTPLAGDEGQDATSIAPEETPAG